MQGGLKRHITSPDAFRNCGYDWDAVYVISDSRLNAIPTGSSISGPPCPHLSPPSGFLVKGSDASVYVMRGGLKRHVPNPVTFEAGGLLLGNINRIPDSSLDAIPTGDPLLNTLADGNLVKGSGTAVYVMQGGLKRHISSPDAFRNCGYVWDAVYVITDSRLNAIPTGSSISGPPCPHLSPPDGTLIKGSDAPAYVMEAGLKRHIVSAEALVTCGYLWGNVNRVPDSSLVSIPVGDDLAEGSCP